MSSDPYGARMNRERWARLKELFEAALALDGSHRKAFLADLQETEPDLHTELSALLTADAAEDQPVDRDPGRLLDGLDEPAMRQDGTEDPGSDVRVGSRIGPWRVEARIGEGGMGVVYRAERADGAFDQSVALKVLRRGMDTEGILARFRSERQILASLEHPNIARLIDGGMTEDGLPWFTLEHVRGRHLTDYCDEQRLSVDARLRLFETVCAAVQYAQERLVVTYSNHEAHTSFNEEDAPERYWFDCHVATWSPSAGPRRRAWIFPGFLASRFKPMA